MEDINRHYCFDIDICQRGNVSDKVAVKKEEEEEEKVRTFESPRRTAQDKYERKLPGGGKSSSRILMCS